MVESTVTVAPNGSGVGHRPVSPAAHLNGRFAAAQVIGPRAVRIREVPFLTMVGVRAVPGSVAASRIEAHLEISLPTECGAVTSCRGVSAVWLSPDEFLVFSDGQPAELASALTEALGGEPGSVIDLSANRTTFELAGPSARLVLEKGCPLDLHPRSFAVGTAYMTLIGSVPVVLWKTGEDLYRILPRSSFADFLGRWLLDAMAEFKAPEIP
jgi:sarcosine oxidase subunit gamma